MAPRTNGLLPPVATRHVDFVCGSRTLDGNERARQYVRQWLSPSNGLVMSGGARGPDAEALASGRALRRVTLSLRADGLAESSAWTEPHPWDWFYDLLFPAPPWASIVPTRRPLARNQFMARLLGTMRDRGGYTIRALALPDQQSTTMGTKHMVERLVAVGITVEVVGAHQLPAVADR